MATKTADIYIVYYKPMPADKDPASPASDELLELLKYELKKDLELGGYIFEGDYAFFNVNRDDPKTPRFSGSLYEEKEERRKYSPRPTILTIKHTNGVKEMMVILDKYGDLDKVRRRLAFKPS